jgi:hypothetical protein
MLHLVLHLALLRFAISTLKLHNPEPPNLVFVHIPKNAGSSVATACVKIGVPTCGHQARHHCVGRYRPLIVLRNPFERFASAVYHAINSYGHEPQIAAIINAGMTQPADWANALSRPESDPKRKLIEAEVINRDQVHHHINGVHLKWKLTYSAQHHWMDHAVRDPYILRYEFLSSDWHKMLLVYDLPRIKLSHQTHRTHFVNTSACTYGKTGCAFLKLAYAQDLDHPSMDQYECV